MEYAKTGIRVLKEVNRNGYNRRLMLNKLRSALSIGMLLMSGCLLIWASIPEQHQVLVQTIPPTGMQLVTGGWEGNPAVLETRQVRLEWPDSLRIGDDGEIRLSFEPAPGVATSPSLTAGLRDVYDSYNLMAEARFEVAGIRTDPTNPVRESMPAGQTVNYHWKISLVQEGVFTGTIWLSLRFLPLDESSPSQEPIFVQRVDIQAASLLGISGPLARLLGGLGIVLSVLVSFDVMMGVLGKLVKQLTTKHIKGTKDFG
ncbi:MAG: hypothetical protein WAV05_06060 [Anaerolineales bacterium]